MYNIIFTKAASKTLKKVPKNVADLILEKLAQIAAEPHGQHNNVTRMKDEVAYRLRMGDWRVIYEIHDGNLVILVLRIASRGSAYKK